MKKIHPYIKRFISAVISALIFSVAFWGFNLDVFGNWVDALKGAGIVAIIIVIFIIIKKLIPGINDIEIIDGVWISTSMYCMAPIFKLQWSDFWISLASSIIYISIAGLVFYIGYCFRKRNKIKAM